MRNDGLAHYLGQISKTPVGSIDDRERLILENLKLCVHIAKQYSQDVNELQDNIQYANLGLMKSVDTYRPEKGKFSVWAALYIKTEIRNNRRDILGCRLRKRTEFPATGDIEDTSVEMPPMLCSKHTLERLTPKQRYVIQERLKGYEYSDIAAKKGTTHQAIRSLEKSACKLFQSCYI